MLTDEQLRGFRRDGYVLVPRLIDAERQQRYEQRFLDLVEGRAAVPDEMVLMRDVMVAKGAAQPATPVHAINKLLNFVTDPVLWQYACEPSMAAVAAQLVGEAAPDSLRVIVSNVFNKPPGVDGRHPLHQDLRYFRLRPADGIVAAWTALSPCSRAAGCLAVLPGSHQGPLRNHGDPDWEYVNRGFYGIEDVDRSERVHVEMQPGDTLFFHPLLVHGSGRNRTAHCRRAISVHYAAMRCRAPEQDWQAGPHVRAVGDTGHRAVLDA